MSALSRRQRYLLLGSVIAFAFIALGLYAWCVGATHWEISLMRDQQRAPAPGLRDLAIALSVAGHGLPWMGMLLVIGLTLLLFCGLRLVLLLAFVGALQDTGSILKVLIERSRPTADQVDVWRTVSSYSFPSGHTLGSTLVFGFLFFAVERMNVARPVQRAAQGGCVAWIALMGLSRVEVGAHWPTDVLGAYLLGALLLLPIVYVLRSPRYQPTSVE